MGNYRCENCGTVSDQSAWDDKTKQFFADHFDADAIDDSYGKNGYHFQCPECDAVSNSDDISKVD